MIYDAVSNLKVFNKIMIKSIKVQPRFTRIWWCRWRVIFTARPIMLRSFVFAAVLGAFEKYRDCRLCTSKVDNSIKVLFFKMVQCAVVVKT